MKTRSLTNPRNAATRRSFKIPRFAKPLVLGGSLVGLLAVGSPVFADTSWTGNAGDNNWTNPANWDNGLPSGQNAFINTTNFYPIITATPGFTPNDIYVGKGGPTGRLDQTAGTVSTGNGNWMQVGLDGSNGTFNLANTSTSGGTLTGFGQGSGTFTSNNSDFEVGRGGSSVGTVNINTSGSLNVGATFSIGNFSGSGTVRMDNGTINANGNMILGQNSGTGTFGISGGTVNVTGETWIGQGSGGTGSINLSGGTFNANNWFVVGRDGGTGTVNVTGGTLTKNSTGQFIVGGGGSTGTLNLNGGTVNTPGLYNFGTGTVNFGGGTLQASADNANFIASSLVVNVNANGGTIDSNGRAVGTSASVVANGGGSLTKTGGGSFTLGGGGDNVSLAATVANGTLILGKSSNGGAHALGGDLTVNNGATAQLGGSGDDQVYFAASVTANGTFDLNARSEGINGLAGGGLVTNTGAAAGVLTVGQNNGNSLYTGAVSNGVGGVGVVKTGTGTLTVNSGATNGFAPNQLTVNGGTLLLGRSNTVGDSTLVALAGGAFATGGFSEGTRAAGGTGVGALTLTATSTLDFGAGTNSILHFAGLGTHTAGTGLTVTNWDGTTNVGGGTEGLLFDGVTSDFTSLYAQSDVSFNGVAGYAAVQYTGYYEIVAVPEPATWLGATGLVLAAGVAFRRRQRATAGQRTA